MLLTIILYYIILYSAYNHVANTECTSVTPMYCVV